MKNAQFLTFGSIKLVIEIKAGKIKEGLEIGLNRNWWFQVFGDLDLSIEIGDFSYSNKIGDSVFLVNIRNIFDQRLHMLPFF